jgi:hypothetical protein
VITLHAEYVRRVAQSYKLLRSPQHVGPRELLQLLAATTRCQRAIAEQALRLAPDVLLPFPQVEQLLQKVELQIRDRLRALPEPEPVAQPQWWERMLSRFLVRR